MELVQFWPELVFLVCSLWQFILFVSLCFPVHAPFWWIWWWLMKTTEISTSLLLPCLLPNLALTVAQFPQPLPSAQVNTHAHTVPLYQFHCLRLSLICHPGLSPGSGECLEHGYVLNSRYQVVYPFPTFQPAFQLKKDQVILLNTSYSLVACGISLCSGNAHMQNSVYASASALRYDT